MAPTGPLFPECPRGLNAEWEPPLGIPRIGDQIQGQPDHQGSHSTQRVPQIGQQSQWPWIFHPMLSRKWFILRRKCSHKRGVTLLIPDPDRMMPHLCTHRHLRGENRSPSLSCGLGMVSHWEAPCWSILLYGSRHFIQPHSLTYESACGCCKPKVFSWSS